MKILDVVSVNTSVLVRNIVGEHTVLHMLVYVCTDSCSGIYSISNEIQKVIIIKQTNLDKAQIIPLHYSQR